MSLPKYNGTVSIILPRNVKRAVVSILASGNDEEKFYNAGWLYGHSPFREIELLLDGNFAGVSWPFHIPFTGGVDPGLWRPIAD
ncbi:hypothetical protein N7523_007800 [Penicillium sp. IBT 18751x]|nr:hypothetical protein N7523_007800 [Penicillium sp. IBT 18751x]